MGARRDRYASDEEVLRVVASKTVSIKLTPVKPLASTLLADYKVKGIGQIKYEKINGSEDSFEVHLFSKMLTNVWQVGETKWYEDCCEVTMATTVKILKD